MREVNRARGLMPSSSFSRSGSTSSAAAFSRSLSSLAITHHINNSLFMAGRASFMLWMMCFAVGQHSKVMESLMTPNFILPGTVQHLMPDLGGHQRKSLILMSRN